MVSGKKQMLRYKGAIYRNKYFGGLSNVLQSLNRKKLLFTESVSSGRLDES